MRGVRLGGVVLGLVLLVASCRSAPEAARPAEPEEPVSPIYSIQVQSIDGADVSLADYAGRVLLVVNVASRCGFTPQYAGLQQLYDIYKDRGFVVLAFPANNFGGQEPGTNEEIKTFCKGNFGVTFPLFAKISVVGPDKHPLYGFLTEAETSPAFAGEVNWNFNKFLVGRKGQVIGRFGTQTPPLHGDVTKVVEAALAER